MSRIEAGVVIGGTHYHRQADHPISVAEDNGRHFLYGRGRTT